MKYYDNRDNFRNRIHTIRVTFQTENYIGHIAYTMGGNCQGLDLLDYDPDCIDSDEITNYVENDCKFSFNDDAEVFSLTLTNPDGDTLQGDYDDDELRNLIVAIEIVDCKIDDSDSENAEGDDA